MILNTFKRLLKKDYPEEIQDTIEQLSFIINDGFSPLYTAVGGRLSLQDNILSVVRDITLRVDENGIPLTNTAFSIAGNKLGNISQCVVGRVINDTASNVYPSSGVLISFTQDTDLIRIDHVTGLRPNYQWTLRITAYG